VFASLKLETVTQNEVCHTAVIEAVRFITAVEQFPYLKKDSLKTV
jgi:hypothetical protein